MAKPTGLPSTAASWPVGGGLWFAEKLWEDTLLSSLTRTPQNLSFILVLALIYWLDILLLSLPGAAAHTPGLVVPLMMALGAPVLLLAAKYTLRNSR